jgi:hypothetical protein
MAACVPARPSRQLCSLEAMSTQHVWAPITWGMLALCILCCGLPPRSFAHSETSLHATNVQVVSGWNFESEARGADYTCDINNTAHQPVTFNPNDAYLVADQFLTYTLPANEYISKVEIDVNGGNDAGSGSVNFDVSTNISGFGFRSTSTWNQSSLQCQWRMANTHGGNGLDITNDLGGAHNISESQINGLFVRVRRGSAGSSTTKDLRVTGFRIYVTTELSVPGQPCCTATSNVTTSQITVGWGAGTGQVDFYDIERSPDGSSWAPLISVGGGQTSYTNTGLAELTTYYYRVKARNSAGSSGYSPTASATTKNTPYKVKFFVQPSNGTAVADLSPAVVVEVQDVLNRRVPDATNAVTITMSNNACSVTLSGGGPISASAGLATFPNLRLNRPCTGYRLRAASGSLLADSSSAFNITPGPAHHLALVTQAHLAMVGRAFGFSVEIEDAANNRVTTASNLVTIAMNTNPCGGSLFGTTSRAALSGVATFPDVYIDKACSGYKVQEGSSGLGAPVVSDTFSVTPGQAVPNHGGNNGQVSVVIEGLGFQSGAVAKLTRSGETDIVGGQASVSADGESLSTNFDLTAKLPGAWNVVVTNPNLQTTTLANGFTIESILAPDLRLTLVGADSIRAYHPTPFDLSIQNRGNVDALAVPVWLAGIPTDATVALDFPLTAPPTDAGEPDWSAVPLTFTSAGGRYLALVIPRVPPGLLTRRIILTVPSSDPSFHLTAALTPPWADGATFRNCLVTGGVIQNPSCMGAQLGAISAYLTDTPGIQALSGIGEWAKIAWQCEGAAKLSSAIAKAEQALDFMVQPVEQPGTSPATCGETLAPRSRDTLSVVVVSAIDPNDKLGPRGTLCGGQPMVYEIRFENLSTASAAAQRVQLVDVLPTSLDPRTVSLGAIRFGNRILQPDPGLTDFAEDVSLGPNLLVKVNASLDPWTGVLKWDFVARDPATGDYPTNLQLGVLPRNLSPPEGEGSVLFTVKPKSTLASGTQIENEATIIFDNSPGFKTPKWSSTLDNAPPVSHVLPVGAGQDSVHFTVRWKATDNPPDLKDFTVYYCEDGGPYKAWRQNTKASSDTFHFNRGHSYAFYSQASDLSGNVEAPPTDPDAEIVSPVAVEGPGPDGWHLGLEGASPNPTFDAIHTWFTLPNASPAALELFDLAGRQVARRDVGELGPGRHMVVLAPRSRPGLYFLRLTQGGRALSTRVAVIR